MLKPVKWNLWDYIVDAKCLRTDCWEDKYIIVWDWMHWIPMPFSAIWWYTAWDWIKISDDWVISVDPSSIDLSNYYTKAEIDAMLEWLDPSTISQIIERVTALESSVETVTNTVESHTNSIQTLESTLESLESRVESLENSIVEDVKYATITMDWDKETEFSNAFIKANSNVVLTWTSWSPNWYVETYVEAWKLIIKSSEDESWTVIARIANPKSNAFLN